MEPVSNAELVFWQKAAEIQKDNNLKLIEENRKLREERKRHIELFVRIKSSVDEFCQLVGVNPETTSVEEKAEAFNHRLQSIQQERDELQQQVNTLTKFLLEFRKRTPYGLYQEQIDNVLQSIKESPKEEQGK